MDATASDRRTLLTSVRNARCVHTFELDGRSFIFDGESLKLAEVTEDIRAAADALAADEADAAFPLLCQTRGASRVDIALGALAALHARGFFRPSDPASLEAQHANRMSRDSDLGGLTLLLSSNCNLRCVYCYADQGHFGSDARARYMRRDVADAAADWLMRSKRTVLSAYFLGGEPLLHPAFSALVSMFREKASAHGKELMLSVSTNGLVTNDRIIKALAVHRVRVAVTIDGSAESHNAQRPMANGGASFDAIARNADRYLAAIGPEWFTIVIMCTPQNVRHIPEFWHEFRERFGPSVRLSFQPVVVPPNHPCSWTVESARGYRDAYLELFKLERTSLATELQARARGALRSESIHRREFKLSVCNFATTQFAVTTDGDIYPCPNTVNDTRFRLGSVLDRSEPTPSDEVRRWKSDDVVTRRPHCAACWAKFHCGGGCPTANWTLTNHHDRSSDAFCEVYKALAEGSLRKLVTLYDCLDVKLPTHASLCGS